LDAETCRLMLRGSMESDRRDASARNLTGSEDRAERTGRPKEEENACRLAAGVSEGFSGDPTCQETRYFATSRWPSQLQAPPRWQPPVLRG